MNIGSYHSPQIGINGLNNAFIIAQRTYRETHLSLTFNLIVT